MNKPMDELWRMQLPTKLVDNFNEEDVDIEFTQALKENCTGFFVTPHLVYGTYFDSDEVVQEEMLEFNIACSQEAFIRICEAAKRIFKQKKVFGYMVSLKTVLV